MTDRELVNKVLTNGDQQSFAEIMRRYSGMVYSKALGIVRREDLAKDIAQQTFIRAYERMAYWHSEKLGSGRKRSTLRILPRRGRSQEKARIYLS